MSRFSSANQLFGLTRAAKGANRFSIYSYVDNSKSYTKTFIFGGIAALFLMMALSSIPTLIFHPQTFTLFFTLSILALLGALASANGPQSYIKKMTQQSNLIPTSILLGSIILSLWFSMISSSYMFSLLFCIIEVKLHPLLIIYFRCSPSFTTSSTSLLSQ